MNDSQIAIVRDNRFLEHRTGPFHPERPVRLRAIYRLLDTEYSNRFAIITPEPAKMEYLSLVHSPQYIETVRQSMNRSFTSLAPDTPVSSKSYHAARLAVGGCIQALNLLLSNKFCVCLCLVRPPGHHSLPEKAGGYCIFNNLGITAKYAIQFHHLSRILIIDWDIHHGNGIQALFYEDSNVFYFSTHDITLYPNTGDFDEIGKGNGIGYTVNVPIPREFTDTDFYDIYRNLLESIIPSYCPELILVAAGFDGHYEDSQSLSQLTENVFMRLTQLLMILRSQKNIPILFALEGGYTPKALARCIRAVLTGILDNNCQLPKHSLISSESKKLIDKIRNLHSPYRVWT